ncbi:sensor histidine kinase [Hymenobacter endophyticus]|uniref:Histidine kinase n=1 Tax=Hymenobacter endophyticus TaxID=3076335 RepID=A0ABU3TMW7_9BACT|nr:histidine kinase [Hymenobacter endophyticus]MDU0372709.1 histidine kinase [Hymenobacter endophyticus]
MAFSVSRVSRQQVLRVIVHVAAWVAVGAVPRLLSENPPPLRLRDVMLPLTVAGYFYLNYYVLVPRLFARRRFGWYFLAAAGLLALVYLPMLLRMAGLLGHHAPMHHPPFPPPGGMHYSRPPQGLWLIGVLAWIISTGLRITEEWFDTERARQDLANKQLTAELAFLKSQVSPHFLFNTLNNIYSLAHLKSDDTPEAILKLSQLMRYMLYESEAARVPLLREVEYLRNYIDLQRLRLDTEQVHIQFEVDGQLDGALIEPMLLIPFVENAFKHGVSGRHFSRIAVDILVREGQLLFRVQNSRFAPTGAHDPNSGIGLPNVRQRLHLLYPDGRHQLQVEENADEFIIDLTLTLAYAPVPARG